MLTGFGLTDLDPVTLLQGRGGLKDSIERALSAAPTAPWPALLMLDLDRFKAVNDSVGHAAGDTLLRRVAQRLRHGAGADAAMARVSGDGFAVLLPDGAAARETGARLLELVGRPYAVEGHALTIGGSIGFAVAPQDGRDATSLLHAADLALHRAQHDGGNRLRRYEPSMQAAARQRRALENDLRAALAMQQVELRKAMTLEQFELHYQPQIHIATGRVTGCEALLRWRHPQRGMVPPDAFIPLAEEIGVIGLLGDWVLRTACRTAAGWAGGAAAPRVAINISPLQLREGAPLAGRIAEALANSGLPPHRLEIEITENGLIGDGGGTLAAIRQLGVGLALDDFGTGFSSLAQLGRYPFDVLKTDRSFIAALDVGAAAGAADPAWMIRAIAALGRGLGMRTIAEGVETPRQAELVRQAGYTDIQGWLISRPVPAAAVPALLIALDQPLPIGTAA